MSASLPLGISVSQIRPDLDSRLVGSACAVRMSIDFLEEGLSGVEDLAPPPLLMILQTVMERLFQLMMAGGGILRIDLLERNQSWQDPQTCRNAADLRDGLAMISSQISNAAPSSGLVYVWAIPSDREYESTALISDLLEMPDSTELWDQVIEKGVVVSRLDGDSCSVSARCDLIVDVVGWVEEALGRSPLPVARMQ